MPLTTVTVNQNDIDTGVPKDCWACPVQKAIRKLTLPDVNVTVGDCDMAVRLCKNGSISSDCILHEVTLPDIARRLIWSFDTHGPTAVKPISFQIDIPKVYLKF